MEEKYLKGNEKIYYRTNGLKNRPTIFLVHGISGSSSAWIPYEKYFEKKFNIISIDLRGHGKSFRPKRQEDYDIGRFSEDIYRIIRYEKIKDAILITHSLGSIIALDFLKRHQDIIKGAILISPNSSPSKIKGARVINPLLKCVGILDFLPTIKFKKRHLDYEYYKNTGDWNIRRMFADINNTGIKSFLLSTKYAYQFDIEGFLSKIRLPVLVIHGKKDSIFPFESGKDISRQIKGSRFVGFKDSDHIIILNDFDLLSKEIEKFVDSLK